MKHIFLQKLAVFTRTYEYAFIFLPIGGLGCILVCLLLSLAPLSLSPHGAQYILNARWTLIRVNEKTLLCRERMERATEWFCLTSQAVELPLQEMWTREYKKKTERSQGDEMSRADKDKAKRYFREAVDELRREERMGGNEHAYLFWWIFTTHSISRTYLSIQSVLDNNYMCAD